MSAAEALRAIGAGLLVSMSDLLTTGRPLTSDGLRLKLATRASQAALSLAANKNSGLTQMGRRFAVHLGGCYMLQGESRKAIKLFEEVYRLPQDSLDRKLDAAVNLAFAYRCAGEIDRLTSFHEEMLAAIRAEPSVPPAKKVDYILFLSRQCIEIGRHQDAERLADEASIALPSDGDLELRDECIRLYRLLGRTAKADVLAAPLA